MRDFGRRRPIKIWKLALAPFVMFGFAFALVPLYNVLCDVTGFNGRSKTLGEAAEASIASIDQEHNKSVYVTFVTSVAAGLPIIFEPKQNAIIAKVGEAYNVDFIVENRSSETIVGQAIPSVSPPQAAIHFNKIECFCFQEQVFAPNAKIVMPVRFVVGPQIDNEVQEMTLAYRFYLKEKRPSQPEEQSVVKTHNQDFSETNTIKY